MPSVILGMAASTSLLHILSYIEFLFAEDVLIERNRNFLNIRTSLQ